MQAKFREMSEIVGDGGTDLKESKVNGMENKTSEGSSTSPKGWSRFAEYI